MVTLRTARVCGLGCIPLLLAASAGAQPLWPNENSVPALYAWGDVRPRVTLQPAQAPLGPPDEVIEFELGRQTYGPFDLPFPVTLGGTTHAQAYVSASGLLSFDAPLPEQFGFSVIADWPSHSITTIAPAGHRNVVKYPRQIEFRLVGRAGRRVFTVSWVDIPLMPQFRNTHTAHVRFEEATGDVTVSDIGTHTPTSDWYRYNETWLGFWVVDAVAPYGIQYIGEPVAGRSVSLVLSDCDPATHADRDADTLVDACDPCPDAFDPRGLDRDRDGIGDACDPEVGVEDRGFPEPEVHDDDPDGDGWPDGLDNCPNEANPDQADLDGNGWGDACEICPGDLWRWDEDFDGVCDLDNCPDLYNPEQGDADGDGLGDACDDCVGPAVFIFGGSPAQADGDAVCADVDNCPESQNADQSDRDGDGLGDVCDMSPDLPEAQFDDDGVPQDIDDCPGRWDANQLDQDADGVGDACDPDMDGDGVENALDWPIQSPDSPDNCPRAPNPDQADADGDGLGDACDLGPNFVEILFADVGANAQVRAGLDAQLALDEAIPPGAIGPLRFRLDDGLDRFGAPGPGGICDQIVLWVGDAYAFEPLELAWVALVRETPEGPQRTCLIDGRNNPEPRCERLDPMTAPPGVVPTFPAEYSSFGAYWSNYDDDGIGLGFGPGCVPDNCPQADNPDQADADGDGLGDPCDVCPQIADPQQPDRDLDEVGDACDNCPEAPNHEQTDSDDDGLGDACDPCVAVMSNPPGDGDRDGWDTACDNCPVKWNPDQGDRDRDRLGDACDLCGAVANPGAPDRDRDGRPDACDNCPKLGNRAQRDADHDGRGDGCDNCVGKYNPDQRDSDRDGRGDVCDATPGRARAMR
jgi:hypothetical protein